MTSKVKTMVLPGWPGNPVGVKTRLDSLPGWVRESCPVGVIARLAGLVPGWETCPVARLEKLTGWGAKMQVKLCALYARLEAPP
eukprot:1137751-Karenia_brevis.AAC.1